MGCAEEIPRALLELKLDGGRWGGSSPIWGFRNAQTLKSKMLPVIGFSHISAVISERKLLGL